MGAFVEMAGWAVAAVLVWIATLSSTTVPELSFAIAAGVLCGVLAHAGRRALGGSWRLRARWLLWIVPMVASALLETIELLRVAIRPRSGRMSKHEFPDEPAELLNGREAIGTVAVSATPGSIVADYDPEKRRLLLHVLVSAGPRMQEVIRR